MGTSFIYMSNGYAVIWFEGSADVERTSADFATYEDAEAWAQANVSPEVNGSTVPNLPNLFDADADGIETYAGREYINGMWFAQVNRYAAIVKG